MDTGSKFAMWLEITGKTTRFRSQARMEAVGRSWIPAHRDASPLSEGDPWLSGRITSGASSDQALHFRRKNALGKTTQQAPGAG